MAKHQEITAVPIDERWRRESFVILNARPQRPANGVPGRFSLLGDAEPNELQTGLAYRFWGSWQPANDYGQGFKFNSFAPASPHGRAGVTKYLQQARHVGAATAETLWEAFRGEAVQVLRETPERAVEAVGPRFTIEKAREAAADLQEMVATEHLTQELYDLTDGFGFGRSFVTFALKTWGAEGVAVLRDNPYSAMAARGVGFDKADRFWVGLGKPLDAIERQANCLVYYTLKEANQQGSVWVPSDIGVESLRGHIASATVTPENALQAAVDDGELEVKIVDGKTWVADAVKASQERYVADRVVHAFYLASEGVVVSDWETRTTVIERPADHTRCARCRRRLTAATVAVLDGRAFGPDCITKVDHGGYEHEDVPLSVWLAGQKVRTTKTTTAVVGTQRILSVVNWPDIGEPDFADLTHHQYEQLAAALGGPIGILGGRPGTGKSFTLVRLVKCLVRLHGARSVRIMAPTGKAAQRVKELMAEAGIPTDGPGGVEPTTIHRGLGVVSSDGDWTFAHNESNPLDARYVILEESSMISLSLFRSLMAALPRGCGLLLVGDVNQLPPVEAGSPLQDLIASGLPYGELKEIHRNSGSIVRACSAIVDGRQWWPDEGLDLQREDPANLVLVPCGASMAAMKVRQLLERIRDTSPFDPVWSCQVLVAVNKRSPLARVTLNRELQAMLNPNGVSIKGSPFRVGDKVIQLKNGFLPLAVRRENRKTGAGEWAGGDEKVMVCNGDVGRVVAVEEKKTVVTFFAPERTVVVFRAGGQQQETDDADEASANGKAKDTEDAGTGCDLDLAYAVTCHKLQGSQADIVIVCLDEYPGATGDHGVCDRGWLYTAMSRAKKACFLVGMKHVADGMTRRSFIGRRKTFLRELLTEFAALAGVKFQAFEGPEDNELW